MNKRTSEERLAENEVIFRQHNLQVEQNLLKLKRRAKVEGYSSLMPDVDFPLHFYCECSNEKCRARILLRPDEHHKLRKNNKQFILKPSHELPEIERVVYRTKRFVVAEKFVNPPKYPKKLNSTKL